MTRAAPSTDASTVAGAATDLDRAGEGGLHVFGIRHHGPGSARSLLAVLDEVRPTRVLVEWPADGEAMLEWIGEPELVPPVAVLATLRPPSSTPATVTGAGRPHAFWPLAEFSPEWQAVLWARRHGAAVSAIDVPCDWMLGRNVDVDPDDGPDDGRDVDGGLDEGDEHRLAAGVATADPLAVLAAAAGESDAERWWDDIVEHRGGDEPAFVAVAAAMAAVRGRDVDHAQRPDDPTSLLTVPLDRVREAHMRRAIALALDRGRDGDLESDGDDYAAAAGAVAVVCGAWHAPALTVESIAASRRTDRATLRAAGLGHVTRRSKAELTWVPWSDRRLRHQSGYAAGVAHPGWYRHLFAHPGADGVGRFLVDVARSLRGAGLAASADHLIAATRLADALAALRRRPRAGLAELLDAADAVLADSGAASPGVAGVARLGGVLDELTVGNAVGAVPPDAPQLPLLRDVLALQRRLRLRPVDGEQMLELDLRTPTGLARSHLLHRLDVIAVEWGALTEGRGTRGTFRETWTLQWDPAMVVRIVEHGAAGLTLEAAAGAVLTERSASAGSLPEAAALVQAGLLADLPAAVDAAVATIATRSAETADVAELIDALPALARAARYGDVRVSDAGVLGGVIDELAVRVIAGLPGACRNLDDDASAAMVERLTALQGALATLDHDARRHTMPPALVTIADDRAVNGLIQGRASRLLHDDGHWSASDASRRLGRALTPGTEPAAAARFVEGFLAGSGTVLVHDHQLLGVVDEWISTLGHDAFAETVPLLRRTFGAFEPAERRQLGDLVARDIVAAPVSPSTLDDARVAAGLATVRLLLGLPPAGHPRSSGQASSPELLGRPEILGRDHPVDSADDPAGEGRA